MNFFEIFTLATVASGQLTLNSSLPCNQLENLNLIDNVRSICTAGKRNRFRCQLRCEDPNQTPWPLKNIGCKVVNSPGSWKYSPQKGKE